MITLTGKHERPSFIGLLETITSTENSKDCLGICVHPLATLICYEVLEDIKCPTASMKCCVESSTGKLIIFNHLNNFLVR